MKKHRAEQITNIIFFSQLCKLGEYLWIVIMVVFCTSTHRECHLGEPWNPSINISCKHILFMWEIVDCMHTFCCLSLDSPLPEKLTLNKAIIELMIYQESDARVTTGVWHTKSQKSLSSVKWRENWYITSICTSNTVSNKTDEMFAWLWLMSEYWETYWC